VLQGEVLAAHLGDDTRNCPPAMLDNLSYDYQREKPLRARLSRMGIGPVLGSVSPVAT
jgi:hypothetical protein